MKVEIHKMFEYLLKTTAHEPEAVIGYSLARSPALGAFLDDLDPELRLDWNNRSFLGLPELRAQVLRQASLDAELPVDSVLITMLPVSAAVKAISIVSRSRISPRRITSGSWRRTCFKASWNVWVSAPTSR